MTQRSLWIQSAAYDLPLIALAPLTGLLICGVAALVGEQALMSAFVVEAGFFIFGMPHYLSTYTFFLDDTNLRHYKTRKIAFVAGPVLIIAALVAATALHLFAFVAVTVALWNAIHVSRQSSGILSIYRHRAGGNHPQERVPANNVLVGSAVGMLVLGFGSNALAERTFGSNAIVLAACVAAIPLGAAAWGLLTLLRSMKGRGAGAPEWVFLATSLALFTPYLLLESLMLASSALLIGHYVQYMAILWLINRRKYVTAEGSVLQRALVMVSRSGPALAGVVVALAIVPFALDRIIHNYQWNAVHALWLNAVVLLHFYFDGLFWAFRDPHVRRSLAPFALSGAPPAGPALNTVAPPQPA